MQVADLKGGDPRFDFGGEGGIRTHGTREGTTVFETAPIDHSRTSPHEMCGLVEGGRTIATAAPSRKPTRKPGAGAF